MSTFSGRNVCIVCGRQRHASRLTQARKVKIGMISGDVTLGPYLPVWYCASWSQCREAVRAARKEADAQH